MVPKTVLDTDVLSALMREHSTVRRRAEAYLAEHPRLTISLITRYEILRGLKAKGATSQRAAFDRFCEDSEVLPITEPVTVRAADIYAELRRRGTPISDADILLAATALEFGFVVATNNEAHLGRVSGLSIDNWLTPQDG